MVHVPGKDHHVADAGTGNSSDQSDPTNKPLAALPIVQTPRNPGRHRANKHYEGPTQKRPNHQTRPQPPDRELTLA